MSIKPAILEILASESELLNPKQVALLLGIAEQTQAVWRCSNRYGWRDLSLRVGGRIRYRRADLERWLEARRVSQPAK